MIGAPAQPCPLCQADGGVLVWRGADFRVIRAEDEAYPAFYRVVCNRHVAEFSDLDDAKRARCMALVVAVERVLRASLAPTKINLAALGNMVPHLHWHVIARFDWDDGFPQAVWAPAMRRASDPLGRLGLPLTELDARVAAAAAGAGAVDGAGR